MIILMIVYERIVINLSIYHREQQYLALLSERTHTVHELSEKLFISEPTVRRDIIILEKKELITCQRGIVSLKTRYADQRIPLAVRDMERTSEKKEIALKAANLVKDGDTIMMDASTTAFFVLPHLTRFQNLLVITNGAKTALEAASLGIRTICTGGEMTLESFSYVGTDAETMLLQYHADVAFFSCRGIDHNGLATDNSILENAMRRIMIKQSKKSYLLCDSNKFGNTHLNTLCHIREIDGLISNTK